MRSMLMVWLHRPGAFVFVVVALLVGAGGCATPSLIAARRMAHEGYCIWYPAESGIEPGQIWLYDGTLRSKFADRAPSMVVSAPQPALPDVQGLNDAGGMLSSKFTEMAISKAGEFDAELVAGTVRSGTFRLGPIESVSIELGDSLLKDAEAKYGSGYAKALQMVRDDTLGLVLIAAVVRVKSVEYTLHCEDSYALLNRLSRIQDLIHARIEPKIVDERTIQLTLMPIEGLLTIGVTPVRGEQLMLSSDQARKALAHDLMYAQKQSYALNIPVPNIISAPEGPIVMPDDSAVKVVASYRAATQPVAQPATTQGSSGRVLSPDPAPRPARP